MACIACGRHICWECPTLYEKSDNESPKCCCGRATRIQDSIIIDIGPPPIENKVELSEQKLLPTGGGYKADDEITVSAGRKRAAVMYEINPLQMCEWSRMANCGGGKFPIIGCLTGKQENRHHGPDKTTSNNARENIHLICANCHNLWHAKNDPYYNVNEYRALPHSPRPATPEELLSRGKSA